MDKFQGNKGEQDLLLIEKVLTEATHGDRYAFDGLNESSKQELIQIFIELKESGESLTLNALWEVDFETEPVDPYTFLTDDYYMGGSLKDTNGELFVYDRWMDDLLYVLDPKNDVREWIMGGAIGIGKSTIAELCQAYKTYILSCLRNPQAYYGLIPGSMIVIALFNLTLTKSDLGLYYHFSELLNACPYFRERFPPKAGGDSIKDKKIELPKAIHILTGSQITHALSLNVFGGILDEMNFRRGAQLGYNEHNQSYKLYNEAKTRISSRFGVGKPPPGLLCNISSAQTVTDYLEDHIKACRDDKRVHISKYSAWGVHDPNGKRYRRAYPSNLHFHVVVGNQQHDPEMVDDAGEAAEYAKGGRTVLEVPEEHRPEFERDLPSALQNVAGVSTSGSKPLFTTRGRIFDCVDPSRLHPFTKETITLGIFDDPHLKFSNFFLKEYACLYTGYKWEPRVNPYAQRAIHVDLGRVKDAAAISMGHIFKMTELNIGAGVTEQAVTFPVIYMDFTLQIPPPKKGEIDFHRIVEFILWLRDVACYNIAVVSYDGWQSDHSIQLLKKKSMNAVHVSVDKTDGPYIDLKNTILDGNLNMYEYSPLLVELPELQHELHTNGKWKVNHLPNKTKDVSDTVAGVVHNLLTLKGAAYYEADDLNQEIDAMEDAATVEVVGADDWVIGGYKVRRGYQSAVDEGVV